jgi:hypothetical protein
LLERARQEVLTYLDFVTHDLVQGASFAEVRREIDRAAERLTEIADHWPDALERHVREHLAARRTEHEREWRASRLDS